MIGFERAKFDINHSKDLWQKSKPRKAKINFEVLWPKIRDMECSSLTQPRLPT